MGAAQSVSADYRDEAIGVTIMLLVLTTVFVVARACSRHMKGSNFAVDDFFAYLAYFMNLGQLVTCFMLFSRGIVTLKDVAAMTPEQQVSIYEVFLVDGIFYILAVLTVKMSVLFLLRRIFSLRNKWFRLAWWANVIFLFPLWTTVTFGLLAWQQVNSNLANNRVGRIGTPTMGGFNVLSDAAMLVLPLWMIRDLHLPTRQKFGVAIIFAIGLIATFVSIVRVIFMTIPQSSTWVVTYRMYTIIILSVVESSTGLMCACLLVSKPVLVKINHIALQSVASLVPGRSVTSSIRRKSKDARSGASSTDEDRKPAATHPGSISRTDEYKVESIPMQDGSPFHNRVEPRAW